MMATERSEKKKKYNIFSILLIFNLNLYIPFLIWDIVFLIIPPVVLSILIIVTRLIINLVSRRKNNEFENFASKRDYLSLIKKYIRINRKYIMASTVGLIIAVGIFSSSHLVVSSYENELIRESDFDSMPVFSVFRDGLENYTQAKEWIGYLDNYTAKFIAENGYKLTRSESYTNFNSYVQIPGQGRDYSEEEVIGSVKIKTFNYSQQIFRDLSSLNSFDLSIFNAGDTIAVVPADYYGSIIRENGKYILPIMLDSREIRDTNGYFDVTPYNHFNYTLDSIFFITDEERWSLWNMYSDGMIRGNQISIFQDQEKTDLMITEALNNSEPNTYPSEIFKYISTTSRYYIDLSNFKLDFQTSSKYNELGWELENRLQQIVPSFPVARSGYSFNIFRLDVRSPLGRYMGYIIETKLALQSISLVANSIVAILALFMVYFSISLVEKRKKNIIATMRVRGTEISQIQYMLIFEVLISSGIAILIGMIISIPWARITLNTIGYFEFQPSSISVFANNQWYYKIPLLGAIISLDINYFSIISLSSVAVDEAEVHSEVEKPFWQRKNIDLVLFVMSALYWAIIPFLSFKDEYVGAVFKSFIGFYFFLVLLISTPLVTSRFFSTILNRTSITLWKKNPNLIALSMRTMQKFKFSISKLVALIMIASLLSIIAIITPSTVEVNREENAKYDTGADMVLQGVDLTNQSVLDILDDVRIEAYSEYVYLELESERGYSNNLDPYMYKILGIDPKTIADALYWNDDYDDKSLEEIVSSVDDDSILMQSDHLMRLDKEIGDDVDLSLSEGISDFTFNVTGTYKYFPKLVYDLPRYRSWDGSYSLYQSSFIGSFSAVQKLADISYPNTNKIIENGIFVNLLDTANVTQLITYLQKAIPDAEITAYQPVAFYDIIDKSFGNILYSTLQSIIILSILTITIAFMYFTLLTMIERGKEIGVFRSMGMIRSQLFRLFVFENLIILLSGILIGTILGLSSIGIIMEIIKGGGQDIPPLRISYQLPAILLYYLILLSINSVIVVLSSDYLSKREVGSILRAE